MPTTQTTLFPPTAVQKYLLSLQMLLPLRLADTSGGSYSEALPPAGLNSTTGQSNQNQEIVYIKTTVDANTFTITGAITGNVVLATQYALARFKSDGTNWWSATSASGGGGVQVGPRPSIANWAGWTFSGGVNGNISYASVGGYGDGPQSSGGGFTGSAVPPTATEPNYFRILIGASAGNFGGIFSSGAAGNYCGVTLGILKYLAQRVRITLVAAQRCWIGMIDVSLASPLVSAIFLAGVDTPPNSFVGFRYSTVAGDTHWMAVVNTAGTQTVVSTGITPDGNGHVFAIQPSNSGATVNFLIDGTQVASISTNVPAASFVMRAINSVQGIGAAMDTAWVYRETLP
jgi:hypothetical protein